MIKFVTKRIISAFFVIFLVSIITFIVLMLIPGNPASLVLGTEATPETLKAMEEAMGLNEPWYLRYLDWIGGIFTGDWGTSYVFGENVLTLICQRLPVTIILAVFSMILALIVAFLLGILSALKKGSFIDITSRTIMQIGGALPSFWIAMIFMIVFAHNLGLFPVTGFVDPIEDFGGFLKSITLPCVTLAIGEIGILIRIVRSSMLSSLNKDYMLSAKIKGLKHSKEVVGYALRSAVIAPITISGLQFAKLLGGTVVVESIFALPGIGRLLLTSVEQRDIILLQGIVLFITTMVVAVSLVTDCVVMLVNPSIKTGEGNKKQ